MAVSERTCWCNRVKDFLAPFETNPDQCKSCWEYLHAAVVRRNIRPKYREKGPEVGRRNSSVATKHPIVSQRPTRTASRVGPGTEAKAMLSAMGVPTCGKCAEMAAKMDEWGPEGCKARRSEIVTYLESARRDRSWIERLKTGAKGAALGIREGWLNPLDPVGSLVDEAIRRAEEKLKVVAEADKREMVEVSALVSTSAPVPPPVYPPAKWAYGVTTVPARRNNLLLKTLDSLKAGGFDAPRLFIDGATNKDAATWETQFGLEVTTRYPLVRTAANWVLSMYELYVRDPSATRFAIFQDDFITYKNLRDYLDRCSYPDKGYLNLYTMPSNQKLARGEGWYPANQNGRGAVALVFSREALMVLLASMHLVERPQDVAKGYRSIDGGIVTAMRKSGWSEYVHNPSLVQHTGDISAMRNAPHAKAESFRGEDFDALTLLRKDKV